MKVRCDISRTKKWWTPAIDAAHSQMAGAQKKRRGGELSQEGWKEERRRWFRTVRKAKCECWESFLQEGKEEDIWKAIGEKGHPPR